MEMICPQCRAPLAMNGSDSARCTSTHAAQFQVLFKRAPRVPPPPATPVSSELAAEPSADAGGVATSPPPLAPQALYPGMHCVQHPAQAATAQCKSCGGYMCPTCDFLLPGGVHLCPTCATRPQTGLSPARKRAMIVACALAAWGTLWMGVIFAGVFAGSKMNENLLGWIFILVILVPAITGFSWGFGAINRRLANPPLLWVATIWNGLILGGFLLLCIIGAMNN